MEIKGKLRKETYWTVSVEDPKAFPFGRRMILVVADSALEANTMMADFKVLSVEAIEMEVMRKVETKAPEKDT